MTVQRIRPIEHVPNPEIGSDIPPRAAEVEPPAFLVPVGGSANLSVSRTYRELRKVRLCDLLGQWVSGMEPLIFEQIDVSPTVLLIIGIAAPGHLPSRFTAKVTVDDLSIAMGWRS